MAEITNADEFIINFQDDVDDFPLRKNFANYRNRHNQLNTTVNSLQTAASGAETSGARLYHETLDERLNSIRLNQAPYVKTGFEVSERGTPDLTVKVKAGQANVGGVDVRKGFTSWTRVSAVITHTEENHGRSNGQIIEADVSSSEPALPLQEYTIANKTDNTYEVTGIDAGDASGTARVATFLGPVVNPTNTRKDVPVINSDNSLSLLTGNDSVDSILPAVANTQRPLGRIDLTSSGTITNSKITDISGQGCIIAGLGEWHFDIQAAVDALDDRTNSIKTGHIIINAGEYYEEVVLTGLNNIELHYHGDAIHLRPDAASRCIISVNTVSNETVGLKITGGDFRGNGKTGAIPSVEFKFTDNFMITGATFDGNVSSTAIGKDLQIDDAARFIISCPDIPSQILGVNTAGFSFITNELIEVANGFKAHSTAKNAIDLFDTTGTPGMTMGSDTNIYRASPNNLKTDDSFEAVGRIKAGTNLEGVGGIKLSTAGLNTFFKTAIFEIGDWNMPSNSTISVSFSPLSFSDILWCAITIRNDADTIRNSLSVSTAGDIGVGVRASSSGSFSMTRHTGGVFDDADYNATSYNRGWIVVMYT